MRNTMLLTSLAAVSTAYSFQNTRGAEDVLVVRQLQDRLTQRDISLQQIAQDLLLKNLPITPTTHAPLTRPPPLPQSPQQAASPKGQPNPSGLGILGIQRPTSAFPGILGPLGESAPKPDAIDGTVDENEAQTDEQIAEQEGEYNAEQAAEEIACNPRRGCKPRKGRKGRKGHKGRKGQKGRKAHKGRTPSKGSKTAKSSAGQIPIPQSGAPIRPRALELRSLQEFNSRDVAQLGDDEALYYFVTRDYGLDLDERGLDDEEEEEEEEEDNEW